MDLGLSGGWWVVTGGTSGLGLAAARAIAAESGRVAIVARDAERVHAAAAQLGSGTVGLAADLADDDVLDAVAQAGVPLDEVRGAIVSYGGPPGGAVSDVSDAAWRDSFESVFLGPVRLTRDLVERCPRLEAVVWVLSTSVRSPIAGLSISNGLRPGMAMLVKDMADTWGARGVRVVAVLPGRFDTPRVRYLESLSDDPAATRATAAGQIPLRRLGEPGEFGDLAAFLVSPRASYVTGSVIAVDGGATRAL